ncbi:hypothetical protein NPIL_420221 [Nephila pilipes]|uniref:Uncharacterized protein n=1 Tax=Nephila pilipes TaxID=299642 RepID=A0A8X6JTK3_NEPPI|nr:hypothetical protein NPIL_420221 [Nephila pilipes]
MGRKQRSRSPCLEVLPRWVGYPDKVIAMFCRNADFNCKPKNEPINNIAKKVCFNANELAMGNPPKRMIHLGGFIIG